MTDVVTVSPREITDLVYRACRVAKCGASLSETIAADATFCEIHFGRGVDGVLELIEATPCRLRNQAIEAQARNDHPQDDRRTRSHDDAEGSDGSDGSDENDDESDDDVQTPFVLRCRSEADDDSEVVDRDRHALAAGVGVNASSWARLERRATAFLLAERVIDER